VTLLPVHNMAEKRILDCQSDSTKRSYAHAVKLYEDHRASLPHSESTVLAFLNAQAATKAPTTLWSVY
jgi:hypothetical protein